MASPPISTSKADHLAVLIHGLWGNPKHLQSVLKTLREAHSEDKLHILVVKSNSSNFTYDGIDTGGERIAHEIESEITRLESISPSTKIRKLSLVGYSLGGLIARYAIGLFHSSGLFDRVEPVNFTTFATPHLGVKVPIRGTMSTVWNALGARTLSTSGQQLFLTDDFHETGRPLLAVMADPKSVFVSGLKRFRKKVIYANIINDKSAGYHTSAFERVDPYVDLAVVELNAVEGTGGVVLDPKHPVKRRSKIHRTWVEKFKDGAVYTLTSIPFFFFITVMLPFGAIAFLTNAGIQSFRSAKRRKLHDTGAAGITVGKYRESPFLSDEVSHVADKVFQTAAGAMNQENYLPTPPSEEEESTSTDKLMKSNDTGTNRTEPVMAGVSSTDDIDGKPVKNDDEKFPVLALTRDQFDMIRELNKCNFIKYGVNIQSVRHTHAAIIVRIPWRPGMTQGWEVLKHWAKEFEL